MQLSLGHLHAMPGWRTLQPNQGPGRCGMPCKQSFRVICMSLNGGSRDCMHTTDEQQQGHAELPQQHCLEQRVQNSRIWCEGLAKGTFAAEVKCGFPQVDWQPSNLFKVLALALPAAATAVGINSQLRAGLLSSELDSTSTKLPAALHDAATSTAAGASAAAAAAATGPAASIHQLALLHLSQEAVLALLLPAACRIALGPRVTAGSATTYWTGQTLGTCLLLFPLVDPLLSSLWQPAAEAILGPAPANPLVATLQQAGAAGQLGDVGAHCLASGVLGPLWEEVFWRGFFLTALTKVLPIPACIAWSAFNFAALHLSPHNFLPLLVLGATCDCLYLRSGGNLLAPFMLHGLWNMSQVLQIAFLHKDTFV